MHDSASFRGDVLITKDSESWEDIGVPALVKTAPHDLICGYHLALLRRVRGIAIGDFLHRALSCRHVTSQLFVRANGVTRFGLSQGAVKSCLLPIPPVAEQGAIARFLERAVERIDGYVRGREKLIALLEEQKQVVIQDAVTGRIDVRTGKPYPTYKPSGIDWLGNIPAHWNASRIKAEFSCLNHRRIPLSSMERGEMTSRRFNYYGASGVIDKVDNYLFDDELLLLAEDGANLVLRNLPLAIIARGKFWVNNHAHILKPRSSNLEYLAAVLEGLNFSPWISGAAQPKLTQDRLMSIPIAVPPRTEQDRIVAFFKSGTSSNGLSIQRANREIDLLREYRTRLIADVVTGKLDVREAVAELPDANAVPSESGADTIRT